MTILKFTKDEIEKLRNQIKDKKEELAILNDKSPSQLWEEELDIFMDAYEKWEEKRDIKYEKSMSQKKGSKKMQGKRRRNSKKGNNNSNENTD